MKNILILAIVNYIGFQDKDMALAGGCGDTIGGPQIDKTDHLRKAYEFDRRFMQSNQTLCSALR